VSTWLTNRQVIRAFRHKEELKAEAREIQTRMKRDAKRLEFLDERIEAADKVSEVRGGIALSTYGELRPVANHDVRRWGEIYLNQHNKTTWGIYFKVWLEDGGNAEEWGGANHPSEAHVLQLLEDWVLRGKLPKGTAFRNTTLPGFGRRFDPLTGKTIYEEEGRTHGT
jgi:hypothetical protein